MSVRAAWCAALLGLSGCVGWRPAPLPPASAPYAPPPAWSSGGARGGAGAELAAWWRRYRDPLLERLVARALEANAGIAASRAALLQARAGRDAAAAALAATLNATVQAQHSQSGRAGGSSADAGVTAGWQPDVSGGARHALAAGQAQFEASVASMDAARLAVAAEVVRNYIELRGAQARRAIAQANLDSQDSTRRLTDWRVQAGLLTSLEEQQAVSASAQAAAQVAAFDASVAQLGHGLALLCGLAPAALGAELAPPQALPEAGEDVAPAPPAEALRQRPDVRAAELLLAAARARAGQADAARYPVLRLEGTLGLNGLGAGGSGAALLRTLLASLAGSAFDGGAARARSDLARGALAQAQAQADYLAAVLTALREVEDALAALAGERRRIGHLRQAVGAAANAALLARQRYASGLADYQTVLETQRALYAAQDGLAAASSAAGVETARLYQALGGGWRPAQGPAAGAPGAVDAKALP
ncbi:efflux transporter outer membrane subunit [Pseudoduganella aquatica]|uniref:efflux transporter outer membrane subunit n=1 Tax=Pseudoduganella aquatica TaxID=2660641 RepID=UPI001E61A44B|nr:efflux transporter outer membrane subunit [Pseudoduganella aquatica]